MTRALAAAALLAAGCGGASAPPAPVATTATAARAAIWFHPEPSAASWTGAPSGMLGSFDFLALFASNAAWPRAMAHTRVLGLYAGWVLQTDDQTLQRTIAFAGAQHLGIELEAPALQATASCGGTVEGYVPAQTTVAAVTLAYLSRLKALGADVRFVKVDEPFFFGSVVTDPRACGLPIAEVVAQVNAYVRVVQTVYPNAQVGDVEPIITSQYTPDVVSAIGQYHAAYQAVAGLPFPFFFADIDFSNPSWAALVKNLEARRVAKAAASASSTSVTSRTHPTPSGPAKSSRVLLPTKVQTGGTRTTRCFNRGSLTLNETYPKPIRRRSPARSTPTSAVSGR